MTQWPPPIDAVPAEDGVPLHVEYDGPADAPLTVVFTHGFTASSAEWAPQRPAVRDRARLVFWDHRGHGASGWTRLTRATIDQTGRDLEEVLRQAVPPGPVVLVGHSMGGMSIMALARRHPELFGDRVRGVFLLATSAGGLAQSGIAGAWIRLLRALHLVRLWLWTLEFWAPLLERTRRRGSWTGRVFTRRYLFGRRDATPETVREVQQLLERTPLTVTAAFYSTFLDHDEEHALTTLARVPVTIVAAQDDRLTPAAHARRMAQLIGGSADLVVVPGAGHSVNFTRPEVVNRALTDLLDRVAASRVEPGAA